jgi:tRNA-dihydrouridine synthase B
MLKNDTILAPMAGLSDVAFRELVKKYHCGLTITEMISTESIINKHSQELLQFSPYEKIKVAQLFGFNVESFLKASKMIKVDKIDLNLGCPAPKVYQQGAGSALLKNPDKIYEIVKAIKKPVSCKIRSGFKKINYLKVGKVCQEAGAEMITLHSRTAQQGYSGKANWQHIKNLKKVLDIPVVGNGDVNSLIDYHKIKDFTNCDYVMIGREAMKRPFIFAEIFKNKDLNYEPKKIFKEYLTIAQKYNTNFTTIKHHAQLLTKGLENGAELRMKISATKSIPEIRKII